MLILPRICVSFMLDVEQTQNKGLKHLCQITHPVTKFGTLSIQSGKWKSHRILCVGRIDRRTFAIMVYEKKE